MPAIKGTASVQDSRAYTKAMRSTKFPASFATPIHDIRPVHRAVMEQWISTRITALLGFEDEIVENTATNLFLPESSSEDGAGMPLAVDPRRAQIDLAGFLGDESAASFAAELWELLLDAVKEPTGIPRKLLEAKKQELAEQQKSKQQQQQPPPPRQERGPPQGLPLPDRRREAPRRVEDDRYEQDGRWENYRNERGSGRGGWNDGYGRGLPPPPHDYYGRPPAPPPPDHQYRGHRGDNNDDRRRGGGDDHDRRPPRNGDDVAEYDEYGRRTRYRGEERRRDPPSRNSRNRHRRRHRRRSRSSSRSSGRSSSSSSSSSSGSSRSRQRRRRRRSRS